MAALQKSGGASRALRGMREERCSLRPPASGKKRLWHRASREEEGGGEDEEDDIDAELESMLGNADEQDASSSFSISADADAEADEDDLLNEPFDSSAIASNDDHLRHPNGADGSSSSNNADSAETEGELKEMTVPHFRSSMMLSALLDIAGNEIREYRRTGSSPELIEITGLTHDVRALAPCDVFVCVPGHIFDGHKYAESAARLGASAIVAERELRKVEKKFALPVIYVENARWALVVLADAFYGMPSRTLNACVGITGTNGKTTTAYLIKAMLEEANHDVGMASTIAQEVGDTKLSPCGEIWQPDEEDPEPDRQVTSPGALAPYYGRYPGPPATTPDALNIQQLINGMTEEGADAAVIECTSHALHQGRVSRVHFDTVVSTNLTHDYLDGHGSFWEYKRANMRLFSQLVEEQEIDDIMVNDDDLASTIEHRKKGNENLNALDVEDEQPLNGEETRTADEDEEDDPHLELTDEVLGSDEEDDEESEESEDLEAERAALADMEEDFGEPRSEGSIDGFSEEGIPSARSESLQSGNAARPGKGRNGEIEAAEEEEEESDPDVQNMELPDLPPRRAVINADDPDYVDFVDVTYPLECVKYSRDPERTDVDVVADTVQFSLFETELDIRTPNGKVNVLTPLIGEPNVMNVLAAVATGVARDVPLDTIKAGIESVVSVPGRLELIDLGQPYAVVVDYAHTPDALDRLLQTVHEVGAKRIITGKGLRLHVVPQRSR